MKTKILAIAFAALMPFAAFGGDAPSYSFLDGSFQQGTVGNTDMDGIRLKANFAFNEHWFLHFDYSDMSMDPTGDFSNYNIAAGWTAGMFFVTAGVEGVDGGGGSESGIAIDGGIRTMLGERFELNGHVGFSDNDFDSYMKIGAGGVFMFGDSMGISFNFDQWSGDLGPDVDFLGVGFRWNFN